MYECLYVFTICIIAVQFKCTNADDNEYSALKLKRNPAPDNHRCGVCPTYFQKICAFDHLTNSTFIFDNHCMMDLYNCIEGNEFVPIRYDNCIYFGNFAYVHGFKYEGQGSKKNPDFIRRLAQLEENIFDFGD